MNETILPSYGDEKAPPSNLSNCRDRGAILWPSRSRAEHSTTKSFGPPLLITRLTTETLHIIRDRVEFTDSTPIIAFIICYRTSKTLQLIHRNRPDFIGTNIFEPIMTGPCTYIGMMRTNMSRCSTCYPSTEQSLRNTSKFVTKPLLSEE